MGACLIDTAESYGTEEIVGKRQVCEAIRFPCDQSLAQHFRHRDLLWLQTEASNVCGLIISILPAPLA